MKTKGLIWASIALVVAGICIIGATVWGYYEKNSQGQTIAGSNSEITEDTQVLEEIETETSIPESTEIVEPEGEEK